jgi:hypothetical protein
MNREEKEITEKKRIENLKLKSDITSAIKTFLDFGDTYKEHELTEQIFALFPEYKVKIDCPECGGGKKKWKCEGTEKPCPQKYTDREKGSGYKCWLGHFINKFNCPTCKGNKTVPTDLADGVIGEIIKIKE